VKRLQVINYKTLLRKRYANKETDEFLKPIIVDTNGLIKDKDVVILFNFRSDRMRQLSETLGRKPPFSTALERKDLHVIGMTQYDAKVPLPVLYPPQSMKHVLAEWLSVNSLAQFHTAETEKYAHVTFFFNGGQETAFPNEDRKLVQSPKVPTYDLKPEMSVAQVGETVIEAIASGKYHFVMCNLAPPDMVGHTGIYEPTIKAVEATDATIGNIWKACQKHNYILCITSDHGNAEEMFEPDGKPKTAHTTNLVPFIITKNFSKNQSFVWDSSLVNSKHERGLRDVAPTICNLLGLKIPSEMTGSSLLKPKSAL